MLHEAFKAKRKFLNGLLFTIAWLVGFTFFLIPAKLSLTSWQLYVFLVFLFVAIREVTIGNTVIRKVHVYYWQCSFDVLEKDIETLQSTISQTENVPDRFIWKSILYTLLEIQKDKKGY